MNHDEILFQLFSPGLLNEEDVPGSASETHLSVGIYTSHPVTDPGFSLRYIFLEVTAWSVFWNITPGRPMYLQ